MFSENPPFPLQLVSSFLKATHIDSLVAPSVLVIWKTKVSFLSLKTLYLIKQIDPVNH